MLSHKETINGILCREDGHWIVSGGYGKFPLANSLQHLPGDRAEGEPVIAQVENRVVTDYHFAPADFD